MKTVGEKLATSLDNNPVINTNTAIFLFSLLKINNMDKIIKDNITIEIIIGIKLPILLMFAVVNVTSGVWKIIDNLPSSGKTPFNAFANIPNEAIKTNGIIAIALIMLFLYSLKIYITILKHNIMDDGITVHFKISPYSWGKA